MTVKKLVYFGFNDFKKHKRGVENVILSQLDSLKNSDVQIIYIYIGKEFKVHKYSHIICIEIASNFLRFICLNIVLCKLSKRRLKTSEHLFIHSHNYLLSFFSFWVTNVFTVHDGLSYAKKSENSGFSLLWKMIEKNVYKRSRKIHFISDFSLQKSLVNKLLENDKIVKIFNTTTLEKYYEQLIHSNQVKKAFEILIVRTIERRANLDLILEVAQKIKFAKVNIKVTVIGKGPLFEYYRSSITSKNLGNIEMLGYLSDKELSNYYNRCNLVIVPCSYGEGFGLPVIEGYLFNKPVLVSNVCALPEIVISNEDIISNDPSEVFNKIIDKLEINTNINYSKYYKANFSGEVIKKKYKDLLYSNFETFHK